MTLQNECVQQQMNLGLDTMQDFVDQYDNIKKHSTVCTISVCTDIIEDSNYKGQPIYNSCNNGFTVHDSFRWTNLKDPCDHNKLDDNFIKSFKQIGNKSYLISVLIPTHQVQNLKQQLLELGNIYSRVSWDETCHLQIYQTAFGAFTLLNLFITNNMQPQILCLGYDCYQAIKTRVSGSLASSDDYNADDTYFVYHNGNKINSYQQLNHYRQLEQCVAKWNTDNPIDIYKQNITAIGTNIDWQKIEFRMLIIFHKNLGIELEDIQETDHSIIYLDLAWFMSAINKFCNTIDQSDITEYPQLRNVVNYLAQKIA